jgi:hypothetical protein
MKTEPDSLSVWLWKYERTALIRERGWQCVAARLAREFAAHARVLDVVGDLEDPAQAHALLSGLVERQELAVVMMVDLFDALGCGCRAYPAPWSSTYQAEMRASCVAWDASRVAHHARVLSHCFETFADAIGGDESRCNILQDSIRRHPIFVVEVLQRLSNAAAVALQRGAHGKA